MHDSLRVLVKQKTIVILALLVINVALLTLYLYLSGRPELISSFVSHNTFLSIILGFFTSASASLLVFWLMVRYIQPEEIIAYQQYIDRTVRQSQKETPAVMYQGSKNPNPKFNHDINESYMSSRDYFFSGNSGKYVPARIYKHRSKCKPKVRIVLYINNPFNEKTTRAMDTHKLGVTRNTSSNMYIDNFIVMLFGFFKCYSLFETVDIILSKTVVLNRVEFGDSNLFLEAFLDSDIRENEFPTICRYDNESFVYNYFHGNVKSIDYSMLTSDESIYNSDFGSIAVKNIEQDPVFIDGMRLSMKREPLNDDEIIAFITDVVKKISGIDLYGNNVSNVFIKLQRDV